MIKKFTDYVEDMKEVGYVDRTVQGIVEVEGLPGAHPGEMVMWESGQIGQITALGEKGVEALVLDAKMVRVGTKTTRTGQKLAVEVGQQTLGKTISVLGKVISGGMVNGPTEWRDLDTAPGGIAVRKKINKPMSTGLAIVDLMVPIGKGQRELIIGDRKTGKSYLLFQSIVSQAREGAVCVYAGIGKKRAEIMRTEEFFSRQGVLNQVVIVAASSQDSPGEIHLCPYTAMAVAEYFKDQGRDVLVVLDDMTTHAKFYRELSLLSRKFPGRDSYPGDIFHVHSKLLERAGNFITATGEVAITCLPVAESVQGDITGYIQTNLMSMTDGHIYFDSDLFLRGRRPAINPFISVTRVGRQTQTKISRDAGRLLFDLLNNYEKTQSFLKFGAELGENSRQVLAMGEKILNYFNQPTNQAMPLPLQITLLAMLVAGSWNGEHEDKLIEKYQTDSETKQMVNGWIEKGSSMNEVLAEISKVPEQTAKLLN